MAEQFDRQQFSGLELLPTSMLEEIIQTDFNGEANYSEEMVQYVLELIAKRREKEQPETIPNIQEAWKKLRLRVNEEESLDFPKELSIQTQIKSSHRNKRIVRYVAVVAACIAVLFAMLITVQALGVDVFGAIGRWTDDIFRFETTQEETTDIAASSNCVNNELGKALSEMGIPTSLAPTWIPKDYDLMNIERSLTRYCNKIHVEYIEADGSTPLTIEIEKHLDSLYLPSKTYEKNFGSPELYKRKGKQFYLFSNCGTWTATWGNTKYGINIFGADSKETAIAIIDSIQEVTNE